MTVSAPKLLELDPRTLFTTAMTVFGVLAFFAALLPRDAPARDATGLSDTLSPEQNAWVKGLANARGELCCDEADGLDPTWEEHADGYRVMYDGKWLQVPVSAVLNVKNKIGVARVWVALNGNGDPFVRCFLPGAST